MERPNILLISFDDAVAPWPYYNVFKEPLQTPNLMKLCKRSTVFHSAYSQAPVCGPSRASMMTGMMPPELGVLDNSVSVFDRTDPTAIWSFKLKESGYFCSSGGKVHHGYKPLRPLHHDALYSDRRKRFSDDMRLPRELRKRSKKYGGHRDGRGTPDGIDDSFYYDDQSARSAVAFLDEYERDQPFYREVGFYSPHGPHLTPARFKEIYNIENLRKPADWADYVEDNAYVLATFPENESFRSDDWWRKCVRNYFSAFSHGDYHLGRVLDALANSRHVDNTIVIVVSDHGFHLGNRNLFQKSTMWEQSLHVPLIIFDPSDPVGRVIENPVALIDVGPTVLDFAGVAHGHLRHGRSLRRLVDTEGDPDRSIPSFFRRCSSVRKGSYRIIRYGDGSYQLFDITADYWQLNDLGDEHPAFLLMQKTLEECLVQYGFDLSLSDQLQ